MPCRIQRFTESEAMFKEALEIQRRLAKDNPKAYEPYVANTLNNLALLYYSIQRVTESKVLFNEALEINGRLDAQNLGMYQEKIALLEEVISE